MITHARRSISLRIIAVVVAALGVASSASAASLSFTGKLVEIWVDDGLSMLDGAIIGQEFSGSFHYGDTLATVATTTINGVGNMATYEFDDDPYLATLTSGAVTVSNNKLGIVIRDNISLSAQEAYLASIISQGPVTAGTSADVWSIFSLEATTYLYDVTPLDGIDNPILIDGGMVEVALFSLDTDTIPGIAFDALPPTLGGPVRGLFIINQSDALGNVLFSGLGEVTSVTAVPLPAGAWLLLTPIMVLLTANRRRGG